MNEAPNAPQDTPQNDSRSTERPARHIFRTLYIILAVLAAILVILALLVLSDKPQQTVPAEDTVPSAETPAFKADVLVAGRQFVWDTAFLPDGRMLFTERNGTLSAWANGQTTEIAKIPDVLSGGEGGLMGLAVDPKFAQNRHIYTCYNTATDIRVVRFQLTRDMTLSSRNDIITGIPTNNTTFPGRHSGCRVGFGPDDNLWVGTGDVAKGDTAIQPKGLGGKILRVTRDGQPAEGNLKGEFDPRIYSYGHRNVQGLAFFPAAKRGAVGLSIEHGSHKDDEVNELRSGNFGWAPSAADYQEDVPMTDTARFPDAIPAIWSSGEPTQAPSGGTIVQGATWKGWNGALAMAMLKDKHLKVLRLDDNNQVTKEERVLSGTFGRIRSVVQGPDNALYIATDNGSDDKIVRISVTE